jgi:multiple sugar transport system permease protein
MESVRIAMRSESLHRQGGSLTTKLLKGAGIALLVLGFIGALLPIYWTLITSLRSANEVRTLGIEFWPRNPTLENFKLLFDRRLADYTTNSVAGSTVLLGLLIATPAGYAAARFHFPGKRLLLGVLLFTVMVPGIVIIVPLYIQMARWRLLDTYVVLIVLTLAYVTPFTVWLMKGFFEAIPANIDNAALVDGYSPLGAFVRAVLPLARHGMAAGAVYIFIQAWNSFLYPLIFTSSDAVKTLPLFLYSFIGFYDIDWGRLTAAALIAASPVIILYVLLQRVFLEGLVVGSVKG